MKTNFTFRHVDSDERARGYAEERIAKLERYFYRPLEANVVITQEKFRYQAEITLTGDGTVVTCKEESTDLLAALEQVLNKIEIQAQRHRDRFKRRKSPESPPREESARPAPEATSAGRPQIFRSNRFQPKPLSVDEAAILLQQNSDNFIVFRNSATEMINVLYRRRDGNFGLIEPDKV